MQIERKYTKTFSALILERIRLYIEFTKFRLASLVVISAVITFLFACYYQGIEYSGIDIVWLSLGGFLVTGASNGLNQVIEVDLDKLMDRTKNRPLPSGRMTVNEGLVVSGLFGLIGVMILWFNMNRLSGILGIVALVSYALIYTPLKRKTPFAVFVGAFPGAFPPVIGWTCATGEMNSPVLWMLFAIQFVWQFPHFWAIAWKVHDDYLKAGFRMLPSAGGKDLSSAFQILVYSLFLIPVSLLPHFFSVINPGFTIVSGWSSIVLVIAGLWMFIKAYKLYKSLRTEDATKLMFASFFYLPIVQLALLIDKLIF